MKVKNLALKEVEYSAYRLAKKFMSWNEPILDFGTRFPEVLESCLLVPFQTYARKNLYRGLINKAAILFYLMIKNHPFENGNKRIAVMTLLLFLYKNNAWIKVSDNALYKIAVRVAEGSPQEKDFYLNAVQGFLKENMVRIKK
ncbi:MAG: type II toxin-antitoxin system death-on-curing family toxin [Candidatus Liptonbacteria bacterium]|nr:type II toxin-antitoxin system death-on-curing family toxin [Candidatus Liptonbacteria bacterium]